MSPVREKKRFFDEWRVNAVYIFFISAFIVVILRLFQIQVINHDDYRALAESQYSSQFEIPAKRGEILSSDGYVLAGAKSNYLLFAEPKRITDPYKVASDLAEILSSMRSLIDSYDTDYEEGDESEDDEGDDTAEHRNKRRKNGVTARTC